MSDYVVGLDLGKSQDFSAVAVLERRVRENGDGRPLRDYMGRPYLELTCVHLERYPLGTDYLAIVGKVGKLIRAPQLQPNPILAIDGTGCGAPVVDLFLDASLPAEIAPVVITGGSEARKEPWGNTYTTSYRVPKSDLVGCVQAGLSDGRLKVVPGLELADVLRRELLSFQVKVTAAAHETFDAREGEHDDLVLSVAIAAWIADRTNYGSYSGIGIGATAVPLDPRPRLGPCPIGKRAADPDEEWNHRHESGSDASHETIEEVYMRHSNAAAKRRVFYGR